MKTFAEIQDGVIVNVSVWESETPQGEQFVEITDIANVGIGWSFVDGKFIEPVPVSTPPSGDIPVTEV
jgi:hypothetical protein